MDLDRIDVATGEVSGADELLAEMADHPPSTTAEFELSLAKVAGEGAVREFDEAMRK